MASPLHHTIGPTFDGWLTGVDSICYGGDYNPEQWPEAVWEEDVALMREAGVNLVSIGMFSWALLEPREGEFDFAWLDRLIELLHTNGIRIDLGTPTASAPAWFFHAYPQSRVVTREGGVLGFGSRGMPSPSSPDYRRACLRITSELAKRYGSHPALALWHVHNEYGAPVSEDYSAASTSAFRTWLSKRYGSLAGVNTAWGTRFWGQVYGEWEHVGVPSVAASVVNPAQRLDFARFSNDALLSCYTAERDMIRNFSSVPITTNFMAGACPATDLWAWGREVDIVSNDHYLTAADSRNEVGLALAADLTRSVAGGKPWLLLEHSTSGVNWQPRNVAKRAGEMSRNAFSHLGRGADAIMFFQWRASRSGAEKFHSAMLPHAGTKSRIWNEVKELGQELGAMAEVRGSRVRADVAILWDQESFWAQDLEWRPSIDLDHRERIDAFYDRFWRDGIQVDFAHPSQDLSAYRLVVAPASYLLTEASAANLTRFVESGGTLLVSYFSAAVDENDAVHEGGFLAPLRRALGITIEEFLPLRAGEALTVSLNGGPGLPELTGQVNGDVWAEDIVLEGAQVVGIYSDGPVPGAPAITRHSPSSGTGWYVSTRVSTTELSAIMAAVYADAQIEPSGNTEGLEVVRRHGENNTYTIAINHTDTEEKITGLDADTIDLLTGVASPGSANVAAGSVRLLRSPRQPI